ncbi:sigma-70 family RNA polymerase sigma factor [Guyparkeria hydrothermalis]|uniref:sigma-70 family RNA polymerase sigma factor n=1 Tax=Guyparkeria hydrothermalis TaxID=923 RepID=UPI0020208E62|nr:sigma-70 family RNA polymerase sigma factor [Guyparkeria hydrothermalis]MCL7745454.1 sigma-70 family RNA polymerase sigma factor [Guyparkeria hydrothermalis]
MSEEELRGRLLDGLSGDSRAYHAFLQATSDLLRRYFRRRLGSLPDEVEDLVQESLLAIHDKRQTYDPALPVTAWLYAIARYKLADLLRRRKRREQRTDSLDQAAIREPRAPEHDEMAGRDLEHLLSLLPKRQQLSIRHTKLEGLSVMETAQRTGMSESAVKVGVHRGLKTLARLIRGDT